MYFCRHLLIIGGAFLWSNAHGQGLGAFVTDLYRTHRSACEEAKDAEQVLIDLWGYSTEGGEATGYFRSNGKLLLFDVRLFGEMGRSDFSFLLHDEGSFMVLERSYAYNRPFYWNADEAQRSGDIEAFDPMKTIIIQRFMCFDGAQPVYEELGSRTDSIGFTAARDLVALADTVHQQLIAMYDAHRETPSSERSAPIELPELPRPLSLDTALAGVGLLNAISAVHAIGSMKDRPLVETDRHQMPHASYISSSGDAYATFLLHYGSGSDQFAELELSRAEPDSLSGVLPEDVFRTGLGIELGMSEEQILEILGPVPMFGTSKSGHHLLHYRIENGSGANELMGYGYPVCEATLEFGSDGLVEYHFGFEYP